MQTIYLTVRELRVLLMTYVYPDGASVTDLTFLLQDIPYAQIYSSLQALVKKQFLVKEGTIYYPLVEYNDVMNRVKWAIGEDMVLTMES